MVAARLAAALSALLIVLPGARAAEPVAVLELFTSQGCSSCPPADALLVELARRDDVVALSLPVDYWDYLGWKDTLASPMFSARQRAYAMVRGDRKVYTPQMVVNGAAHVVGSKAHAVERAIAASRAEGAGPVVDIAVREEGGQIKVALPDGEAALAGEVWLLAVSDRQTVQIGRGENRERTVTYVNVVRKMTRLGAWKGKAETFMVARSEACPRGADQAVVIVQHGNGGAPGPIRGVARLRLPAD